MTVVVVGGGVAGLTAAWQIRRKGGPVALFEASARLGGQVRTTRVDALILEEGAEGWVARSRAVPTLCRDLGLGDALVQQLTTRALFVEADGVRELPSGAAAQHLGIQAGEGNLGYGLMSLAGGMGTLVAGLEDALGADVHRASPIQAIEPAAAGGWEVIEESGTGHHADAVIVALPVAAMARLIDPLDAEAGALLASVPTVSSISVNLVYERTTVAHPLDASGILFAESLGNDVRACSFVTSKFRLRAPAEYVILRAFFRPGRDGMSHDDGWWRGHAVAALRQTLGLTGDPLHAVVTRWPGALPRYPAGYPTEIAECRRRLGAQGVVLAGSAVVPSGVDGAVESSGAPEAA